MKRSTSRRNGNWRTTAIAVLALVFAGGTMAAGPTGAAEEGYEETVRKVGRFLGISEASIEAILSARQGKVNAEEERQRLADLTEMAEGIGPAGKKPELTAEASWLEQEKQLRSRFRRHVKIWFPAAAATAEKQYGITVFVAADRREKPTRGNIAPEMALLIHGVDEPGRLWASLAPVLLDAGYTVAEFRYPNDQPIRESTRMLAEWLDKLRVLGVTRVRLVAHSMGGLVSRELLTSPEFYNGKNRPAKGAPEIPQLIMVGTPNRGSELARFRVVAEWRDQLARAFSGKAQWLQGVFDGAGEAKIDLLPNSRFLRTLNVRPRPEGVAITIIAGRMTPPPPDALKSLTASLAKLTQGNDAGTGEEPDPDPASRLLDLLGDGAVPLHSTPLEGVSDYVVVEGNHLTIIRNYNPWQERTPPAVPIILDRLRRQSK